MQQTHTRFVISLICLLRAGVLAALPRLQQQVEGFPMPAQCRASQLLLTVLEGLLLWWLMRLSWRAWSSTAVTLCSWLGVAGLAQQVRWVVLGCLCGQATPCV
jgi:hypothetical protein